MRNLHIGTKWCEKLSMKISKTDVMFSWHGYFLATIDERTFLLRCSIPLLTNNGENISESHFQVIKF